MTLLRWTTIVILLATQAARAAVQSASPKNEQRRRQIILQRHQLRERERCISNMETCSCRTLTDLEEKHKAELARIKALYRARKPGARK